MAKHFKLSFFDNCLGNPFGETIDREYEFGRETSFAGCRVARLIDSTRLASFCQPWTKFNNRCTSLRENLLAENRDTDSRVSKKKMIYRVVERLEFVFSRNEVSFSRIERNSERNSINTEFVVANACYS